MVRVHIYTLEDEGVAQKKTAGSDNIAKPSTGKWFSTFAY